MHYLYGFVEIKRLQDFRKPGSQAEPGTFLGFESSFKGVENGYPGGIFDPLGLSRWVGGSAPPGGMMVTMRAVYSTAVFCGVCSI